MEIAVNVLQTAKVLEKSSQSLDSKISEGARYVLVVKSAGILTITQKQLRLEGKVEVAVNKQAVYKQKITKLTWNQRLADASKQ